VTAQGMQVDSRTRIAGDEGWELAATEYRRIERSHSTYDGRP